MKPRVARVALELLVLVSVALAAPMASSQAPAAEPQAQPLRDYESRYYIIHTDLSEEDAREAGIRMTRMAEEYYERTKGFSGIIRQRLPFFLFRRMSDYYAAGGLPGSAGVFNGKRLMAIAGERPSPVTWMVVQHEGFHQFAHAVIGGQIPVWANEGLADYFGVGVFTGDGMQTGLIPQWRLKRVQDQIRKGEFKSIEQMMQMSLAQWNGRLSSVNYDQGWSMVHFLAHGDDGKYQAVFATFIREVGRGRPWKDSWAEHFGTDIAAFEQKWKAWWLGLKDDPTLDLYARATTATLTSYLARAHAKKQTFDTFEEFITLATEGKLESHPEDWLPPSVLKDALKKVPALGTWSFGGQAGAARRIVCRFDEQTTWVGSFTLQGNRVAKVTVEKVRPPQPKTVDAAAPARPVQPAEPARRPPLQATRPAKTVDLLASAISLARAYRSAGNDEKARATLEKALAEHPASPAAVEARELLNELQ